MFSAMTTSREEISADADSLEPPIEVFPDEVVSLHMLDDTVFNRRLVVCWTMRFDHVLDAELVHFSLVKLLRIGDWRKLGGRLRKNTEGKLVLHIPRPFTAERPPVHFSHDTYPDPIAIHPLAAQLPRRTSSPSLHPSPLLFRTLGCHPNVPTSLDDYLNTDSPALHLHIVSFPDATLVSLTWSHVLSDALGMQSLARAWGLVMAGRDSEVPALLATKQDPMSSFGTTPSEKPPVLAPLLLKGWALFRFVTSFLLTSKIYPATDSRTIFLPASTVQQLRHAALADLPREDEHGNPTFLSEGDVVTAWLTRTASTFIAPSSTRPVLIHSAVDLRTRISSLAVQKGVFVQNLVAPAMKLLPARHVLARPLGQLALDIRNTIREQADEKQLDALFWLLRQEHAATGKSPVWGANGAFWLFFTSWDKCKVWETVDFRGAVVGKKGDVGGKPGYFHTFLLRETPAPNGFQIGGRDAEGNYWVVGNLHFTLWRKFEEEMQKLNV